MAVKDGERVIPLTLLPLTYNNGRLFQKGVTTASFHSEILEFVALNRLRFFYGYVIVAAAFFIQTMTWGINNSFGVFFNPLLTELAG